MADRRHAVLGTEALDLLGPAFIEFSGEGMGTFSSLPYVGSWTFVTGTRRVGRELSSPGRRRRGRPEERARLGEVGRRRFACRPHVLPHGRRRRLPCHHHGRPSAVTHSFASYRTHGSTGPAARTRSTERRVGSETEGDGCALAMLPRWESGHCELVGGWKRPCRSSRPSPRSAIPSGTLRCAAPIRCRPGVAASIQAVPEAASEVWTPNRNFRSCDTAPTVSARPDRESAQPASSVANRLVATASGPGAASHRGRRLAKARTPPDLGGPGCPETADPTGTADFRPPGP